MSRKLVRRHAALTPKLVLLLCALSPKWVASQSATGTVQGTVRAALQDAPLPFAVVSIPTLSIERFSDAEGRFTLAAVPVGTYEFVVRRIGYVPFRRRIEIVAAGSTQVDVRLSRIPAQLTTQTVRAIGNCPRPGSPDRTRNPMVAELVSLLRENADRYRLLATQHPFQYLQVRATGVLSDADVMVQRVDTILVTSAGMRTYRPGAIVTQQRNAAGVLEYVMTIPTIVDLADDLFAKNHCFAFGGSSSHDGEAWLRLDVRAADKIRSPDVHGSFYLDSASSELRRMDLTMSRPDRLPRLFRNVEAVDVVTSFRPIASGLSVIDKVCGQNRLRPLGIRTQSVMPVELQQLLTYEFTAPPPFGVEKSASVTPPADWIVGSRLPRSAMWCTD